MASTPMVNVGYCQHPEKTVVEKGLPYEAIILAVVNVLKALYFLTTGSFYKMNRRRDIPRISQLAISMLIKISGRNGGF